jgi:hypothetical protein
MNPVQVSVPGIVTKVNSHGNRTWSLDTFRTKLRDVAIIE